MEHDRVATLVAEWERERPDLDAEPMLVLQRVGYLAELLDGVLGGAFRRAGVGFGEFEVLSTLRRAGMPFALTPSQIVTRTSVTAGAVTKRVDRLVAREHVERTVSPVDGRGRVIRLTPAGLDLVDRLVEEYLDDQRALLRDLAPGEVAALSGLLARVNRRAEQRAQELAATEAVVNRPS